MPAPLIIGGLMLANSLMGEADANDQMAHKAKQYGVNKAGIDSAKTTRITALITQASQLKASKALSEKMVNMSQAEAEAQARVNAAAAGVEGDSVNQIIGETEVNAANAKEIIDSQEKNAQNQLKQNFVDTTVNASQQTGQLDTSTRDQTLQHALSFATGFKDSFVPTSELEGNE